MIYFQFYVVEYDKGDVVSSISYRGRGRNTHESDDRRKKEKSSERRKEKIGWDMNNIWTISIYCK